MFKMINKTKGVYMSRKRALLTIMTGLVFAASSVFAQTDLQKAQNLATCLSGKYPNLCKHEWLTSQEAKKVAEAERQENLKTCLAGRYPSLCRKDRLTVEELKKVIAAEKRENLKTCLTGRYKSLCKKNLLTESELKQVLAAERGENLRVCMTGRYPSLCDRSQLTDAQVSEVEAAEKRAAASPTRSNRAQGYRVGSSACDSGHWLDSVSNDGQIVKLEDGSIWEVDAVDAIDSALWLPTTDIIICNDKLINTDDNETVSARRLR
jgi:hypothetical protein